MPFVMTHLCVAKAVMDRNNQIKDRSSYYLGSLSPDAVHFRAEYNSSYKKASHLCIGPEEWGKQTNFAEWEENVLAFLKANMLSGNIDFILGYCTHILTDIFNAIHIWTPFRLEHPEELEKGYGNIHHQEYMLLDRQQYQNCEYREELWEHLENSKNTDLSGVVRATVLPSEEYTFFGYPKLVPVTIDELDSIRDNVLYRQYNDPEPIDTSTNIYITMDRMREQINNSVLYVSDKLFC